MHPTELVVEHRCTVRPEFTRYIAELRWAQHFALLNREEMMDRVIRQVSERVGTCRRAGSPCGKLTPRRGS